MHYKRRKKFCPNHAAWYDLKYRKTFPMGRKRKTVFQLDNMETVEGIKQFLNKHFGEHVVEQICK